MARLFITPDNPTTAGLNKAERLRRERDQAEAAEARAIPTKLNPDWPFRATGFPVLFFRARRSDEVD